MKIYFCQNCLRDNKACTCLYRVDEIEDHLTINDLLPEKINEKTDYNSYADGYNSGWNDCIDQMIENLKDAKLPVTKKEE